MAGKERTNIKEDSGTKCKEELRENEYRITKKFNTESI